MKKARKKPISPHKTSQDQHKSDQARPFWLRKSLREMSKDEWESLCDGCGRCCLNKIEFEDTQTVSFTNVACKLLDTNSCQCSDYSNRTKLVPDCIQLSPKDVENLDYMPTTCAYRLVAAKKALPSWHHLVSKNPNTRQ